MKPLDSNYTVMWRTNNPGNEIGYCPALEILSNERIIACILVHDKRRNTKQSWTVNVYTSDDKGASWTHRKELPMIDGFPFTAGKSVYVMGGKNELQISRSDDMGETWSGLVPITNGKLWYSYAGSYEKHNGRIYLVKEQRTEDVAHGFPVWILAPVVLSADMDADLTKKESWTFSNVLAFPQVLRKYGNPNWVGAPFYAPGDYSENNVHRRMAKLGWGEANLVRLRDPEHVWFDGKNTTFHIFMRTNTGRSNLAAIAKAVEKEDGSIDVDIEKAPSGEPIIYTPFPGGHIGFFIFYDEKTRLYWLLSNQAYDSMKKIQTLDPRHYGMPFNERKRLVLHFSKNCIDWCHAGLVCSQAGGSESHYGGYVKIDGDDLIILMRTCGKEAKNTHDSNMITFHRVKEFRKLVY